MNASPRWTALIGLGSLALGGPGGAWAAPCEAPSSRAAVGLALSDAQAAFAEMDIDRFNAGFERTAGMLPCLADPLQPGDVARVHALHAMAALRDMNDEAGVNAWRAVLAADPTYLLDEGLAPPGHPLRVQFDVARSLVGDSTRALADPSPDAWWVDGGPRVEAPTDRPFFVQRVTPARRAAWTAWIAGGAAWPEWLPPQPEAPAVAVVVREVPEPVEAPTAPVPAPPEPSVEVEPGPPPPEVLAAPPAVVSEAPEPPPRVEAPPPGLALPSTPPPPVRRHHPWGMAVTTLVFAGATTATSVMAHQAHDEFMTPPGVYPDDPDALRARANALAWGSVGTGAATFIFATATLANW